MKKKWHQISVVFRSDPRDLGKRLVFLNRQCWSHWTETWDLWPFWFCRHKTQDMNTHTKTLKHIASTCTHAHTHTHTLVQSRIKDLGSGNMAGPCRPALCSVCIQSRTITELQVKQNILSLQFMFIYLFVCSFTSHVVSLFSVQVHHDRRPMSLDLSNKNPHLHFKRYGRLLAEEALVHQCAEAKPFTFNRNCRWVVTDW